MHVTAPPKPNGTTSKAKRLSDADRIVFALEHQHSLTKHLTAQIEQRNENLQSTVTVLAVIALGWTCVGVILIGLTILAAV